MNKFLKGFQRFQTIVLGLAALTVSAAALAGVGQWTSSGPGGAQISSLAADPSMPSRVFALSRSGLLRSKDGGASWSSVNSHVENLYALTVAPGSSTLYSLTLDTAEVARSDDDGATWLYLKPNLPADDSPVSLAVDPSSPSTLFLGTYTGVFKSTDGGQTWAATPLSQRLVLALAFDPSNSSTVYAGTGDRSGPGGGVFKSTDAGRSWALVGSSQEGVQCLAIDPAQPKTIYGCVYSGVVRSDDGGTSFIKALSGHTPFAIVVGVGTFSGVYAATYDGLFRTDGVEPGFSPVRFGREAIEDPRVTALAIVPSSPSVLLVAGRDGILKSADAGDHWTVVNAGGRAVIRTLAVDPSTPGTVYAGGDGGVFKSVNSGASWTQADLTTPVPKALAATPRNPLAIYAAGVSGVSKSVNHGATWNSTYTTFRATAIAVAPSNPAVLLAGLPVFSDSGSLLLRSSDGGDHWQRTVDLPDADFDYPPIPSSIAFHPLNPSVAYVAGDLADYFGITGGVFKTLDFGGSWVELGVGRSGAFSVVIDPNSPTTVYVATRDGLIKSADGGTSWAPLTGPTGVLVIDPAAPTTIYSGGATGVFQSLDGGESWASLGPELTGVTALALDAGGRQIYAGTDSGVFAYDLSPGPQGLCSASPASLCLLGGRFRVDFFAADVRKGRTSTGFAVPQGDRFGYFSLPDFTGDATLPEVFVKMVDASWLEHGSFWVFYNGLTNLPYTIVVTDTSTGARRVYHNDGLCGRSDTSAFPTAPSSASASASASTLAASGSELSLLGGRFRVAISATRPRDGRISEGAAIAQSDRFGYFSLPDFTGDPTFPEVCVKMVDATSFTGKFWFFHAGLTSLPYTLTVTDTVTGAVRTHQNGSGGASQLCGGADTKAFSR